MRRDIFSDEHEQFRSQFRRFAEAEIAPKVEEWNVRGITDRETWVRAGKEGFLAGGVQPSKSICGFQVHLVGLHRSGIRGCHYDTLGMRPSVRALKSITSFSLLEAS